MVSFRFCHRLGALAWGAALAMGLLTAEPGIFIVSVPVAHPALTSIRWLPDGTTIYSDGNGVFRAGETLLLVGFDMLPGSFGHFPIVYHPKPMTASDSGTVYIADPEAQVLQRYDEGSKTFVSIADHIGSPTSLAVAADGSVYFNDPAACRVRRFFQGTVSTVAGTGTCGYSNDAGLATDAQILSVRAIAVDASGQLFIADEKAGVVRRVDTNGVIMTIVGTGIPGAGGEGVPANRTPLNGPAALAFDAQGNLFIAEAKSNRVRMVGVDGLIRTVAGNGLPGHDGDDGPAVSAQLTSPQCLAAGPSGTLQICDSDRIRKLIPPAPGHWWFPVQSLSSFFQPRLRFSSPGSWVSLIGDFPGVTTTDWSGAIAASGGSLPTSLAGVSVRVDGLACVMGYVSPDRIDVLLSDRTIPGSRSLEITLPGSQVNSSLDIAVVAPEFLSFSQNSKLYAAALSQDGIFVTPENPVRPGQTVRVYLTGLNISGPIVPPTDLYQPNGMSIIGPYRFRILLARPAAPGVFELTVEIPEIPAGLPAGDVPITLVAGFDPPSGKAVLSRLPIWLPVSAN